MLSPRSRHSRLWVLALCFILNGYAQSEDRRPTFDVASIKLNTIDGPPGYSPSVSGKRVTLHNATLLTLVSYAYGIDLTYQMSANNVRTLMGEFYDIDAELGGDPVKEQLPLMFQTLLEDRFQLKVHWETRDASLYDLVAITPDKLKVTDPSVRILLLGTVPVRDGSAGNAREVDGTHLVGKAATMAQLAKALQGDLHAPVRDLTDLTGTYDFNVRFDDLNRGLDTTLEEPTAPLLEEALRDALGLKLIKSRGPVRVLVVDRVGKLIPN